MREDFRQKLFLRWPMWFHVQGFDHTNHWFNILWRLFADWLRWALEGGNTPLFVRTVAEAAGMPSANGREHFLAWSGEEPAPEKSLNETNGLADLWPRGSRPGPCARPAA
jgi:hypothetical protein